MTSRNMSDWNLRKEKSGHFATLWTLSDYVGPPAHGVARV